MCIKIQCVLEILLFFLTSFQNIGDKPFEVIVV